MVEILTIIAIVLGPILAIQIQKHLERNSEERERRLRVFKQGGTPCRIATTSDHQKILVSGYLL